MDDGGVVVLRHPVQVAAALAPSVGGTNAASNTSTTQLAPAARRLFTRYPTVVTKVGLRQTRAASPALQVRRGFRAPALPLTGVSGHLRFPLDGGYRSSGGIAISIEPSLIRSG
jgi:hypothetical protein